jgi:RNase P/RNase MRP subunit p30
VLARVLNPKPQHDLREKSGPSRGVKQQLVETGLEEMIVREQVANSPVDVGASLTKRRPAAGRIPVLQCHSNAVGRSAGRRIKDVRSNRAHALNNFLNLNRVIRRCSRAA